jgi:hypothetical protein
MLFAITFYQLNDGFFFTVDERFHVSVLTKTVTNLVQNRSYEKKAKVGSIRHFFLVVKFIFQN